MRSFKKRPSIDLKNDYVHSDGSYGPTAAVHEPTAAAIQVQTITDRKQSGNKRAVSARIRPKSAYVGMSTNRSTSHRKKMIMIPSLTSLEKPPQEPHEVAEVDVFGSIEFDEDAVVSTQKSQRHVELHLPNAGKLKSDSPTPGAQYQVQVTPAEIESDESKDPTPIPAPPPSVQQPSASSSVRSSHKQVSYVDMTELMQRISRPTSQRARLTKGKYAPQSRTKMGYPSFEGLPIRKPVATRKTSAIVDANNRIWYHASEALRKSAPNSLEHTLLTVDSTASRGRGRVGQINIGDTFRPPKPRTRLERVSI